MKKNSFYTTDEIKPRGWLKRQLEIQAEGLSGNLDKVWRDVKDSSWIGGDAEGWERVPYWLDGFIPLAYLLENEDMIVRVKKYIDAIISFQRPDGWICPCGDDEREKYDTWAIQLIRSFELLRCAFVFINALVHGQGMSTEIDIRPLERDDLATTQTEKQGAEEHHLYLRRLILQSLKELTCLVIVEPF